MVELTPQVPAAPAEVNLGEAPTSADEQSDSLVEEELLVEDVSIDGMCGVY